VEATMPEQSSVHVYLNWAKERIDEMDAALASFEVKASQSAAEMKPKVDQLIADLKQRRDEFKATLKSQGAGRRSSLGSAPRSTWKSSGTDSNPR
jgi:hypothetical protein